MATAFGAGIAFMPHGYCLLWRPDLLWTLIISDALIAIAYFSIPLALIHFVRGQKNLRYNGVFLMFSLFILACGTTHIIEILNIWTPMYWLSAYVKAFTALASVATAVSLWPLLPRISAFIDEHAAAREELSATNQELRGTMALLRRREAEIRESESRYRLTVSNAPIGLATVALEGRFLTVNESFCRMLGYAEPELLTLTFQEITHADDLEDDLRHVAELRDGIVDSYRMTKRYVRKDGRLIDAQLDVSLLRDRQGAPVHFISQVQDITQRVRVERAFRASESKLQALFENLPTAVLVLSGDAAVEYANPVAVRLLGSSRKEIVGMAAHQLESRFRQADGKAMSAAESPLHQVMAEKKPLQDRLIGICAQDGSATSWVRVSAFPDVDADGSLHRLIVTLIDITDLRELEQKLTLQAQTDALTGLQNRRHFMPMAARELARSRRHLTPLSLMMLDVDHFKAVNDTHGHMVGDMVLRRLGAICREILRENDLACRMGGEEFALLFPDTDLAQAEPIAQRLRQTIEQAILDAGDGTVLHWTCSIGVAELQPQETLIDPLLRRADSALYQAKRNGRNQVFCARGDLAIQSRIA